MKEDRKGKKRKKKKKKKRKRKYESSIESSSEEERRERKRVKIDEEGANAAMTRLVANRPSLTADLRTVFVAMDSGQSVVLDDIKNKELRDGLRELFDMMQLGEKGKYRVRSSDAGLMMKTFGDRLKQIETMWETLKNKNQKDSSPPVSEPTVVETTTEKKTMGPSRPPSNYKPAESNNMDSFSSSSSDDEFGPAPVSSTKVRTARPEVIAEMKKREEEEKRNELRKRAKAWHKMGYEVEDKTLLLDEPSTKQTERQSWMTQLPSSRNGNNAFGAIFKKGGKSQFRQRAAKDTDGSWTQTPKEKMEKDMAKKRSELFGIPLPSSSRSIGTKATKVTRLPVAAVPSKRHGKSLLDLHREKMGKKSSSQSGQNEVRWDRERDMSLKSSSLSSNKDNLKKILQSASEMRSRFSSSTT